MKHYLIVDTETANGLASPLIYDLGWVVADENGEIILQRSYVIREVFDNETLFNTAYFKDKRPLYLERLESKYSKKVYLAYALRQLQKDMKKYGVESFAYNSTFDNKAIKNSMQYFNKTKYNPVEPPISDIMKLIGVITETEEYKAFCEKNGFMTKHKKPRPQKKAETLKKFLDKNPNYQEQHTAVEDSKIELEILITALGLMA